MKTLSMKFKTLLIVISAIQVLGMLAIGIPVCQAADPAVTQAKYNAFPPFVPTLHVSNSLIIDNIYINRSLRITILLLPYQNKISIKRC